MHGGHLERLRQAQEAATLREALAASRARTLARKATKRSLAGGAEDGRSVDAYLLDALEAKWSGTYWTYWNQNDRVPIGGIGIKMIGYVLDVLELKWSGTYWTYWN